MYLIYLIVLVLVRLCVLSHIHICITYIYTYHVHEYIDSICWLNLLAEAKVLELVSLLNKLPHCCYCSLIYALGPWLVLDLIGFCGELRVLVCEHIDHTLGLVKCSLSLRLRFVSSSP